MIPTPQRAEDGLVAGPETGTPIALGASWITFKIVGATTGGAYALANYIIAPGEGARRHVHRNEDETLTILSGAVTFQLGTQRVTATAGSVVYIPRNLPHAFVNDGTEPARTLMLVMPAGLEQYFQELDALLKAHPDDPPAEQIFALNEKYQLEFS